jgi:hypothetical protein
MKRRTTLSIILGLHLTVNGLVQSELTCGAELAGNPPTLTQPQVIKLSNDRARRSNFDLSRYHAPEVKYEVDDGVGIWVLLYATDLLDDYFLLRINDRTRKADLSECAA